MTRYYTYTDIPTLYPHAHIQPLGQQCLYSTVTKTVNPASLLIDKKNATAHFNFYQEQEQRKSNFPLRIEPYMMSIVIHTAIFSLLTRNLVW